MPAAHRLLHGGRLTITPVRRWIKREFEAISAACGGCLEVTSALAGYRVYWRATDSPTWDRSAWVGLATEHAFEGLVIDNYFFGVASVGEDGSESVIVFPRAGR